MGEQLTVEETSECKVAFGLYDRDGDGYISTLDLGSALRSMGIFPTDNEIMDILNEVDGEGNGQIDFPHFLEIVFKKTRDYKHEEELRLAFSTYDTEDDGRIPMADFEYIITSLKSNLTDQEIEDIKKEADRKGLGYVLYNVLAYIADYSSHDSTLELWWTFPNETTSINVNICFGCSFVDFVTAMAFR